MANWSIGRGGIEQVSNLVTALWGPTVARNKAWYEGYQAGLAQVQEDAIPEVITLELNDDEASTLADILAAIDGPLTSRRLHTNRMSEALDSVGYTHGEALDMWGSIGFD